MNENIHTFSTYILGVSHVRSAEGDNYLTSVIIAY